MAKGFISVTPRWKVGSETVENVFYYSHELGVETSPSAPQMEALHTDWVADVLPAFQAIMSNAAVLQDVTYRAYTVTGDPSEVLPVIIAASGAGALTGLRDGNVHTMIVAFNLGDLVAFDSGAASLRRSSVRIGPMTNDQVGLSGELLTGGFVAGTLVAFLNAISAPREIATAGDTSSIRVSKVLARVPVAQITAYREVFGAFSRPQTGTARSRTNFR